ncbi:PepSY domain-containing protein [Methyloglobulus sp.]|uniref:PepSY domain-containing protein n=1 Tax=Methyloglobulus sp. TaxID=2518622 RepID=UPI0032B7E40C
MKSSTFYLATFLVLSFFSMASWALDQGLDTCINSAKQSKSGYILKLEKLNMAGKAVYEIEVADVNRGEWEFLCEADTGKIIEKESEVTDAKSEAFKKNMKVTEQDAAATALKAYPGKIEEVEYEIEENGGSSYEFDIMSNKGIETKVEVDAATGKIIETAIEEWEAGEETEERR